MMYWILNIRYLFEYYILWIIYFIFDNVYYTLYYIQNTHDSRLGDSQERGNKRELGGRALIQSLECIKMPGNSLWEGKTAKVWVGPANKNTKTSCVSMICWMKINFWTPKISFWIPKINF